MVLGPRLILPLLAFRIPGGATSGWGRDLSKSVSASGIGKGLPKEVDDFGKVDEENDGRLKEVVVVI